MMSNENQFTSFSRMVQMIQQLYGSFKMDFLLRPLLCPSTGLFFFIINIIFVAVPTPVSAVDDQQYLNCSAPFHCANLGNIGYPFWGGYRPEYCGYPGFKLECEGEVPELTISDITYRILKIDNKSRTMTAARDDYWDTLCPSNPVNTRLNFSLVDYASRTDNLTLYYRCPALSTESTWAQLPNQFKCNSDESNTKNFYFSWDMDFFNDSYTAMLRAYVGSCGDSAIIPVWESNLKSMASNLYQNSVNLTAYLQGGFGLQWFANNSICEECERSNGQCGHVTTTGEFTCFCPDKPYSSSCESGKAKGFSAKAVVSIGVASAAVIAVGLCFFLILRRKRKMAAQNKSRDLQLQTPPSSKSTAKTKSSQSIPLYPYSKSDFEKGSTYFGAQVFSCSELEEATDNFHSSKELGDGGFGTVYLGVLRDGRAVAVKRLYENSFKRVVQFKNEIEILTRLQHPNLVKLYGCTSRQSRELLLVYEYIPNGTVADHLHGRESKSTLPWPVRLSIAIETAGALAYLHESDVIHRDVKTNNILLDNSFSVKVADFGLSRLFPTDVTHVSTAPQGTPGYVDPEYYQCYKLTDKSDVYSFGVVLIELISGLQAVDTNRHRLDINLSNMAVNKIHNDALNELVDPCLRFEKDDAVRSMVTSVAELAFRCLQHDREMRPTMKEVLDILREIRNEHLGTHISEVTDIYITDDAALLKNTSPPLTPESETEKWVSSSTATSSF